MAAACYAGEEYLGALRRVGARVGPLLEQYQRSCTPGIASKQQIPYGKDRKKNKCKNNCNRYADAIGYSNRDIALAGVRQRVEADAGEPFGLLPETLRGGCVFGGWRNLCWHGVAF